MDKLEKLAKEIFDECEKDNEPVTMAEALEMAREELNAKVNAKNYVVSKPKPKAKREVKLDEEKVHLINLVRVFFEGLELNEEVAEVRVTNPQKEVSFRVGDSEYSLSLIKHRPPKK